MLGVSRFDSSFNTTSIPFRRANATTLFAFPKSNPTTLIGASSRRLSSVGVVDLERRVGGASARRGARGCVRVPRAVVCVYPCAW